MAGMEVVVRPVVFPNIRPRPKPSLPPQDDPTKGFAVISGNPAKSIGLSFSFSISSSHSKPKEIERRVDEVRVYQQEDDGTINRANFVDLQVANRIKMEEPIGAAQQPGGGTEGASNQTGANEMKEYFYERVSQQEENIEVRRVNVIMRNGEEFKG